MSCTGLVAAKETGRRREESVLGSLGQAVLPVPTGGHSHTDACGEQPWGRPTQCWAMAVPPACVTTELEPSVVSNALCAPCIL